MITYHKCSNLQKCSDFICNIYQELQNNHFLSKTICISLRELTESNTSVTYRTLSLLQITIHPNVVSVQIFSRSCSLITRPSDTSTDSNRFQRGYTTCVALAVISPSEIWKQSKEDNSKSITLQEKKCNNKTQTF